MLTTKTVDNCEINKCNCLIEVYGDIDFLVSYLGVCKAELQDDVFYNGSLIDAIEVIQRQLFDVAQAISKDCPVFKSHLLFLEAASDDLTKRIEVPTDFVLPGANKISAALDMARCYSRKLERTLILNYTNCKTHVLTDYMNELSKYLYLLARSTENNRYTMR